MTRRIIPYAKVFSSYGRKVLHTCLGNNAFSTIPSLDFFMLKIDHKPLEWLTMVLDAYGHRGRWISML